jgi:hypothetical protein
MWCMKNYSFDLANTMSEEEMIEFWFELDESKHNNYFDAISNTYELV